MMFILFTLVFFMAKILGYISWPWWLVFSPMLILVGLFAVMYGVAGIIAIVDARKAKKVSDNLFRKLRDHD